MDLVGQEEEDEAIDVVPANKRDAWPKPGVYHIIIDCSMMSYVDSVGVNMLRSVGYLTNVFIADKCDSLLIYNLITTLV